MALPSTLYRFEIKISDLDRNRYETFALRVAMHPSESVPFLLTRVLAYSLNLQPGLEFSSGIASPDDPTLFAKDLTGAMTLWVEIGNPSARRLHRASKAAQKVLVYTYRDPEILLREIRGERVHRLQTIDLFVLAPSFLAELGATLARDNDWEILHDAGELTVTAGGVAVSGEVRSVRLGSQ